MLHVINDGRALSLHIRSTSDCSDLNVAFIAATTNTEQAILTPRLTPRVCTKPVLYTVLLTPAKKLGNVGALESARLVLVNARGVGHEIVIDIEDNLDWAVVVKVGHHILLARDLVSLLTLVLVAVPVEGRIADALVGASVNAGVHRKALVGDDTSGNPVVPDAAELGFRGTVRAENAVNDRQANILVILVGDALTVAHDRNSDVELCGEVLPLVVDVANGLAIGPLITGIESVGKVASAAVNLASKVHALTPHFHNVTQRVLEHAVGHVHHAVVLGHKVLERLLERKLSGNSNSS